MSKQQNDKRSSKSRFDEVQKKNFEILKKRVETYNSDDDSDDEVVEIDKGKIDALFANYNGEIDQATTKIYNFFENAENVDCLICIRQIKSKDSIWSCQECYVSFHLPCIQRWANDSMIQKKIAYDNQPEGYYTQRGDFIPKKEISITWDCPQCRKVYEPNTMPKHYECYCGREIDPPVQPFLIPHSCGEICNKPLVPNCGHTCKLICHPRSHPICAQIIEKSCNCKKSPVKTIRCFQQNWSCGKKCDKLLACGIHKCQEFCHEKCATCKESRVLSCDCGSSTKKIFCEQKAWKCEKMCGKVLACGHKCQDVCHSGECDGCQLGMEQTCFCGKQTKTSPTCETFSKESCGSTCLKPLTCGNPDHKCMSRCHKGECGQCLEMVEKKCRCGTFTKETNCSKELLCEVKCKNQKNCKKHSCSRKCCVDCLPCEKICVKLLKCGKHPCGLSCHAGNCYPCMKKNTVKCRCGATSISVNCGRKDRAPKCKELCKISSKCHHDPLPHKCHLGSCPSCVQKCSNILPCSHLCIAKCHDAQVKVIKKDKNFVPKVPGEYAEEKIEFQQIDCPPCKFLMKVVCQGGHEEIEIECDRMSLTTSLSCDRICNRKLKCGNHQCKLICHPVANIDDQEQDDNCDDCDSPCLFKRPCTHPCPKNQCHPKECKRCIVPVKSKCYCGLTEIYYRCCDVYKKGLSDEEIGGLKQKYLSCGSKCIKTLPCGHSCTSLCHPGPCPLTCKKKMKISCKCQLRKIEYGCETVQSEKITSLTCDSNCAANKATRVEEELKEKAKLQEIEDAKNKKELELFEKKFGPKKVKERKSRMIDEKPANNSLKYIIAGISCFVIILAVILYFMIYE